MASTKNTKFLNKANTKQRKQRKVLSSHVLGLRHNIKEDTDDVSLNLVTGGHWQSSYPPPPLSNYQGPTKQMQDIKELDYMDVQDRMLKRIMPFLALPLTPIGVVWLNLLHFSHWKIYRHTTTIGGPEADLVCLLVAPPLNSLFAIYMRILVYVYVGCSPYGTPSPRPPYGSIPTDMQYSGGYAPPHPR
uniref:Uncharacterized protein n=1 Tax=Fagus sylvatica TaxID=28930 RepID=A0A2N9GYL2_FAGSY